MGWGGGSYFLGGGHLRKTCDYGGGGWAIQKTKERWGIFLYYLTKDGLHSCVCVGGGGGGQGTGMGAGRTGLLRYNVIFYFK